MVQLQVPLSPGRSYSRAFLSIQSPELYSGLIDILGHLPAKGINFLDQVSLGQSADGWVTGHPRDSIYIDCEKKRRVPQAGASQGGFAPGVAGPDNDDVIFYWGNIQGIP
jgi:hypothetical protein